MCFPLTLWMTRCCIHVGLADRRERKRKKRAIVNPPQRHDDDAPTEAQKKGRTNGQKAKKPAALALLYGFSATNVTKGRLTVCHSMNVASHVLKRTAGETSAFPWCFQQRKSISEEEGDRNKEVL